MDEEDDFDKLCQSVPASDYDQPQFGWGNQPVGTRPHSQSAPPTEPHLRQNVSGNVLQASDTPSMEFYIGLAKNLEDKLKVKEEEVNRKEKMIKELLALKADHEEKIKLAHQELEKKMDHSSTLQSFSEHQFRQESERRQMQTATGTVISLQSAAGNLATNRRKRQAPALTPDSSDFPSTKTFLARGTATSTPIPFKESKDSPQYAARGGGSLSVTPVTSALERKETKDRGIQTPPRFIDSSSSHLSSREVSMVTTQNVSILENDTQLIVLDNVKVSSEVTGSELLEKLIHCKMEEFQEPQPLALKKVIVHQVEGSKVQLSEEDSGKMVSSLPTSASPPLQGLLALFANLSPAFVTMAAAKDGPTIALMRDLLVKQSRQQKRRANDKSSSESPHDSADEIQTPLSEEEVNSAFNAIAKRHYQNPHFLDASSQLLLHKCVTMLLTTAGLPSQGPHLTPLQSVDAPGTDLLCHGSDIDAEQTLVTFLQSQLVAYHQDIFEKNSFQYSDGSSNSYDSISPPMSLSFSEGDERSVSGSRLMLHNSIPPLLNILRVLLTLVKHSRRARRQMFPSSIPVMSYSHSSGEGSSQSDKSSLQSQGSSFSKSPTDLEGNVGEQSPPNDMSYGSGGLVESGGSGGSGEVMESGGSDGSGYHCTEHSDQSEGLPDSGRSFIESISGVTFQLVTLKRQSVHRTRNGPQMFLQHGVKGVLCREGQGEVSVQNASSLLFSEDYQSGMGVELRVSAPLSGHSLQVLLSLLERPWIENPYVCLLVLSILCHLSSDCSEEDLEEYFFPLLLKGTLHACMNYLENAAIVTLVVKLLHCFLSLKGIDKQLCQYSEPYNDCILNRVYAVLLVFPSQSSDHSIITMVTQILSFLSAAQCTLPEGVLGLDCECTEYFTEALLKGIQSSLPLLESSANPFLIDGICESMVDLLNVLSYTEEWSDFEGDYAGVISDLIDLLQRKSLVKSANDNKMEVLHNLREFVHDQDMESEEEMES